MAAAKTAGWEVGRSLGGVACKVAAATSTESTTTSRDSNVSGLVDGSC